MPKSKAFRNLLKVLASLWILYHLFVISVMPNVGSFVGRVFLPYISAYSNTLGFSSAWNFFSPDPAQTMYIHYFVHFTNEDGDETREAIEGFFPEEKNRGTFDPRRRRDFYMMHFILLNPARIGTLLAPYLCRKYPEASFIKTEFVVETIPPLDQMMVHKDDSQSDLSKRLQFVKQEYPCRVE